MPLLSWRGKQVAQSQPSSLLLDSIIYPGGRGYPGSAPVGRLLLGDNLRAMQALADVFANRVDLIYADPPFFTNRKYPSRIGRGEDSRKPSEWALADGYGDNWADLDSYLDFLYQRLVWMHKLLSPNGTLYLHLDWHANSYARVLLDEIFGQDRLLNEIVWTYHGPSPIRRAFNRKHDTILAYVKGDEYTFNADAVRQPYHPSTVQTFKASRKAGFGKVPDLERGKVPEDWWYFPVVARLHNERTGYPTQKPEGLMERILLASSNPGDLVADFFCGAGTFPAVAERLGRPWIANDLSYRAVHTTRKRLCALGAQPFSVEREASAEIPKSAPLNDGIMRGAGTVVVNEKLPLDYWEIDPAWDGQIFRSCAQAYRSNDSDEMSRTLERKVGRRACVRLVTVEGEVLERELDVEAIADAPDGL